MFTTDTVETEVDGMFATFVPPLQKRIRNQDELRPEWLDSRQGEATHNAKSKNNVVPTNSPTAATKWFLTSVLKLLWALL